MGLASVSLGALVVGIAIDLQPGDAETRDAVPVDRALPSEELLDRQVVALAHLIEADHADANRPNDGGLAPHDPALGVGWREFNHHASAAICVMPGT